jgi:hypothetical protein
MAGFDMRLSSPNTGPVKRIVPYTINDKHTFKVRQPALSDLSWLEMGWRHVCVVKLTNGEGQWQFTVVAEVVPLEVKLSTQELSMAFPEDSLEPSMNETIVMENPGARGRPLLTFFPRGAGARPARGSHEMEQDLVSAAPKFSGGALRAAIVIMVFRCRARSLPSPPATLRMHLTDAVLRALAAGTAPCEFYWGARGAFSVRPEQGTIPAGQKVRRPLVAIPLGTVGLHQGSWNREWDARPLIVKR